MLAVVVDVWCCCFCVVVVCRCCRWLPSLVVLGGCGLLLFAAVLVLLSCGVLLAVLMLVGW